MSTPKRTGQLVAGVILVGLGVVLAIERFADFDLDLYFLSGLWSLWPLIVIGLGLARLLGASEEKQRSSGLLLFFVGVWLLINTLELFGLDWGDSWPVLLILLGVSRLLIPVEGRRSSGVLLLLIGLWGYVNVFEVWGLYWDNSWSIGLILLGLFIIYRALFESRGPAPAKENGDV